MPHYLSVEHSPIEFLKALRLPLQGPSGSQVAERRIQNEVIA